MGFYAPAQLVANARQHGVIVRPIDVNRSDWECTLEPVPAGQAAVRMGFSMAAGLPEAASAAILEARQQKLFSTVSDFQQRTRLSRSVIARLARADAFGSLQLDRRQSLWQALEAPATGPLDFREENHQALPLLTPLSPWEEVLADYRSTGLSLRDHPLKFLRKDLAEKGVTPARDLDLAPADSRITVAGLVLLRQRPGTASGITFVTLEDESGLVNLIIHPGIWETFHVAARTSRLLLASGVLQKHQGVTHVIVERLADLSPWIETTLPRSRDFR